MASVLSFSAIASYFKDNISLLQRGEISYESGNVLNVLFDGTIHPMILKGTVSASMKRKTYTVEVSLDLDDGIVQATCSCPRGSVICHHIASLCLHGHHNISKTDRECQWSVRRPGTEEILTIEDFCKSSKPDYCATKEEVSEEHKKEFLKNLGSHVNGFTWLLRQEPTEESSLIISIEEILFSDDYNKAENKKKFIMSKCAVDTDTIRKIEKATIGQSLNSNWSIIRKNRITASKFGKVLNACRRKSYPVSLFNSLMGIHEMSAVLAVKWGSENEKHAVEVFETALMTKVTATGIWLDECGFLGASPDGIVEEEDALVEIKCPFKYRDKNLSEELLKDRRYIIFKNDKRETIINENHEYWHQIQGQMHVAKKNLCYLVVWTPKECEIVKITKSDSWGSNLDILKKFYVEKFVPFIAG